MTPTESGSPPREQPMLKKSGWNLLLLLPLIVLITPLFNSDSPRVYGLPFFYWFQLACVILGVIAVGIVYVKTRDN